METNATTQTAGQNAGQTAEQSAKQQMANQQILLCKIANTALVAHELIWDLSKNASNDEIVSGNVLRQKRAAFRLLRESFDASWLGGASQTNYDLAALESLNSNLAAVCNTLTHLILQRQISNSVLDKMIPRATK